MQGRYKGKAHVACSFEEAIACRPGRWFRAETFGFSALSGIVSYGRVEQDDAKNK